MDPSEFGIACQEYVSGDYVCFVENVYRGGRFGEPKRVACRSVIAKVVGALRRRVVLSVIASEGPFRLQPGELVWRSPHALSSSGACRKEWSHEWARSLTIDLERQRRRQQPIRKLWETEPVRQATIRVKHHRS